MKKIVVTIVSITTLLLAFNSTKAFAGEKATNQVVAESVAPSHALHQHHLGHGVEEQDQFQGEIPRNYG